MTRLFTLVVLVLAAVSTPAEATSQRLHVTARVVQQTFTGDAAHPKIGDQLVTSVELRDTHDRAVGTGAGVCTIVSALPLDTLVQCLLTAVLPKGQIIFGGVAPLPEAGAVAHFSILGGTDDFRTARGEATLVVITPELQEGTFDLE
jgi:hypothetical protein